MSEQKGAELVRYVIESELQKFVMKWMDGNVEVGILQVDNDKPVSLWKDGDDSFKS